MLNERIERVVIIYKNLVNKGYIKIIINKTSN